MLLSPLCGIFALKICFFDIFGDITEHKFNHSVTTLHTENWCFMVLNHNFAVLSHSQTLFEQIIISFVRYKVNWLPNKLIIS